MNFTDKARLRNQKTAFAIVERLVGGSALDYFESSQTVAQVWVECYTNDEIHEALNGYLWGSFEKSQDNLAKLENKLRAVFGLESVSAEGGL